MDGAYALLLSQAQLPYDETAAYYKKVIQQLTIHQFHEFKEKQILQQLPLTDEDKQEALNDVAKKQRHDYCFMKQLYHAYPTLPHTYLKDAQEYALTKMLKEQYDLKTILTFAQEHDLPEQKALENIHKQLKKYPTKHKAL